MATRLTLAILAVAFLTVPVLADEDPAAQPEQPAVEEATSKQVKHELKVFKKDFDTVDIDFKLDALIRLSKCVHKDVTKTILGVLFKDPDVFIKAEAAKGLGNQVLYPDMIGKKIMPMLGDDDLDAKVLKELILTIGKLDYKRAWESLIDLIAHDEDKVVIAVFYVLGEWKELRGIYDMQEFWDAYPTEGSWSTGSVNVDTGASGDVDQRAAKRKWMAKYGNKRKQRARPDCVKALKIAVKKITGEQIEKPAELRQWRSDHKEEIRAAKRRR